MKTLIIKLGALGDVVRTTPLLRVLEGDILWVADPEALPLLPKDRLTAALPISQAAALRDMRFDRIFCLDESERAAALASALSAPRRVGTYISRHGALRYTADSSPWFDLGLISRLGRAEADRLKKSNTRTYQDILFSILGRRFAGEEYLLDLAGHKPRARRTTTAIHIGLDERAGARWPMKRWPGYPELARLLESDGFVVSHLRQRPTLADFLSDIAACDLVICGDTLTMHLALALGIRTMALFICTSPAEIHDYGRLTKVVSPLWREYFYRRDDLPHPGQALTPARIRTHVARMLRAASRAQPPGANASSTSDRKAA